MYPTKTSGQVIRGLRPFPIPQRAALDGDDDSGSAGEGSEGGASGGDDGDSEGASGSDSGDDGDASGGDDSTGDPEKKKLHDEAAKWRKKFRDLEAKNAKDQTDRERAELAEVDRLKEELADAKKASDAKDTKIGELQLESALFRSGVSSLFIGPDVVTRIFLPDVEIEPQEDGSYDPKAIRKEAEAWLKKNPTYEASGDGDSNNSGTKEGGSRGPSSRDKGPDKTNLAKKFPALATKS